MIDFSFAVHHHPSLKYQLEILSEYYSDHHGMLNHCCLPNRRPVSSSAVNEAMSVTSTSITQPKQKKTPIAPIKSSSASGKHHNMADMGLTTPEAQGESYKVHFTL